HSGVTAGLSPLFDTFVNTGNTITYVASFDETTNLVPLTLDGPGPGDEVARLVVTLEPNAPPVQIQLTLLGGTVLSNQAGTLTETEGPLLAFAGGWIDVRTRAATQAWAMAQSSSEIRVSWNDPEADETGIRLERSPDGASWSTLATLGPDDTVYFDGSLPAATLFYYRVIAFNGG
ncbi:MAG: fibronectin type III domain-containing protein, partial [Actinomycetia bacterium]|nr:fibronectin type III domain-containing protein [Actinomycetes bacterium]